MAQKKKTNARLPWHSAFFAGIQIELEEEADKLTFENEHQLSTKPLGIDVLIIKKQREKQIQKNIGQIFKEHNIIEYKSPLDYLSLDDFYKVLGYACFYKSDVQHVDTIKAEEITISFVCKGYPRKLIKHLKTVRNLKIEQYAPGIYYIIGSIFPIQLILTSRLSKEDNFWLRHLTNDLKKKEDADLLFQEYEKHRDKNLYISIMDLIMRANQATFKEASGNMCDALKELFQDAIDEAVEKAGQDKFKEGQQKGILIGEINGANNKLLELISKKLAKGKSIEQIADELEESPETIQTLMKSL